MIKEEDLLLAQYNQIWEQRRQHVTLIWTIPTVAGAVIAFSISQIPVRELNIISIHLLFLLLAGFSYAVFKIFLRHNAFQQAYGFLLTFLDKDKKPIVPLPQTGEDLFKWCRDHEMVFDFWLQKGSEYKGITSWFLAMATLAASIIFLWLDLTNLPSAISHNYFVALPQQQINLSFLFSLLIGFAGLSGICIGTFLLVKKIRRKAKIALFIIGSALLILNAVLMGYAIPSLNMKLQSISDNLYDVEKKITDKEFKMRDYQMWEAKSSSTRNSLILLEGLNLQDSPQYQRLANFLIAEETYALKDLAFVSEVDVDDKLTKMWAGMDSDQLQDEKKKIAKNNPSPFRNIYSQREKLRVAKTGISKYLSYAYLFTALAQGIALLLLAASELLFKVREEKI